MHFLVELCPTNIHHSEPQGPRVLAYTANTKTSATLSRNGANKSSVDGLRVSGLAPDFGFRVTS